MLRFIAASISSIFLWCSVTAQVPGDIAIISVNNTHEDFQFVALTSFSAGDSIFFSDQEWNGSSFVTHSSDGVVAYIVPAGGITAGHVVEIDVGYSSVSTSDAGTAVKTTGSFDLGIGTNEHIFAYDGSSGIASTFYFAVHISDDFTTNTYENTGLIEGQSLIYIANTYAQYQGSRVGNKQSLLPQIGNFNNWFNNQDNSYSVDNTAFNFPSCTAPTTQASQVGAGQFSATVGGVGWTRGNGDSVIVIARAQNSVQFDPEEGVDYSADTVFGSGSELGDGNYVVYKGTGTQTFISNLPFSGSWTFDVLEYKNSGSGPCYMYPAASTVVSNIVQAGDIIITGANFAGEYDTDQQFSFVTLVDIPGNTDIIFTDNAWNGKNWNQSYDLIAAFFKYTTPPAGLSAGDAVFIDLYYSITASTGSITKISGTTDLSYGVDHLFCYLPSASSNTDKSIMPEKFLFGIIHTDTWQEEDDIDIFSTGLAVGQTALEFSDESIKYTGSLSGSKNGIICNLSDISSSWSEQSYSSPQTLSPASSFTINADCSRPNFPTGALTTVNGTSVDITMNNGTGDSLMVVIRHDLEMSGVPCSNKSYQGSNIYGQGDEIGDSNFVVHKAVKTDSSFTITGLEYSTTYHAAAFMKSAAGCYSLAFDFSFNTGDYSGFELNAVNTTVTIDFDNTVTGVNQGNFAGTGFSSTSLSGLLDSDSWRIEGSEAGTLDFGGNAYSGALARGISNGNITTSGIYSFDVGSSDYAFGFQSDNDNFTSGSVTLKMKNATGSDLDYIVLSYDIYENNTHDGAHDIELSYSTDGTNFTALTGVDFTTEAANESGWQRHGFVAAINGNGLVHNNDFFYIKWSLSRNTNHAYHDDEFALDNISITPHTSSSYASNGEAIVSGNFKSLTINSGVTAQVKDNSYISISKKIKNKGTLVAPSGTSIVQTSTTDQNQGTGTYRVEQQTPVYPGDTYYSFWSAPITNNAMTTVFSGSNSNNFYSYNATLNIDKDLAWVSESSNTSMTPGKGYLTTPTIGINNASETRVFSGTHLNNGDISLGLTYYGDISVDSNNWNLLGNPYPSAIDYSDFQADNPDLDNTVWKFSQSQATFVVSDYKTYTVGMGGSPATTTEDISSCQGFFVQQINNAVNSVTFKNSHRETVASDTFFKAGAENIERFWVQASHPNGNFQQILVGFRDDASHGKDQYDGQIKPANPYVEFAAVVDSTDLAICGMKTLGINDVVVLPLMFMTYDSAQFTIHIDSMDNIHSATKIYLKDNILDSLINLKTSSYTFETYYIGPNRTRFELVIDNRPDVVQGEYSAYAPSSIGENDSDTTTHVILTETTTSKLITLDTKWIVLDQNEAPLPWYLFDTTGRMLSELKRYENFFETHRWALPRGTYILSNGSESYKVVN